MVNRSLRKRIANHESFAAFHAEGGLRRWRSRVSMAVIDAHDSLPRDRIANTMSDADQHEINTETAAGGNTAGSGQELPVSKFEVLPYGEPTNEKELFSFREAIPAPVQPAAPQKRNPPLPAAKVFILIALLAAAAFIAFALYMTLRPKPPAAYVDLGSQRFDPAGLSGRLIARWQTSGSYELFLDPIGPQQAAGFASAAADPPRQLALTIRLLDAAGRVTCQKQILFPPPVPRAPDGSNSALPQGPQQTASGDTIENMTGEGGQIAEIDLSGPLPCPAKAYSATSTWDFVADFPTPAEEDAWLQQEKSDDAKNHGGKRNQGGQSARLPAAIEGDDVIVGDNPSRGTVQTSGGRIFLVGAAGMRSQRGRH